MSDNRSVRLKFRIIPNFFIPLRPFRRSITPCFRTSSSKQQRTINVTVLIQE